jgi:hypothetical protein
MTRLVTILLVCWRVILGALNALGFVMKWCWQLTMIAGLGLAAWHVGRYLLA